MNTLSHCHTHLNLIHYSSSPSFQQFTPFLELLPWPRPPQSIRPPKQRTIHASLPSSPLSTYPTPLSPKQGNVQPTSATNDQTALSPMHFLERAAVIYGDCPSIIYKDITRTWSQTRTRCLKLASSIAALGITRGDVVSVVAPNIPAMCELHFAVPMTAAVLNTINTRLDANTISNLLRHCDSKLVFVDPQFASLVFEAVTLLPPHLRRPILVFIGDQEYSPSTDHSFDHDYEDMVENGDAAFEWVRPRSEWDPIALNYTSGTTAAPKGVVQSHRSAFLQSVNMLFQCCVPQRPVYLWTVPMFHCNGWSFPWGLAAVGGVNVCLRRVDAPSIYQALEEYGVTHMGGAPVVLNMLSNYTGSSLSAPVHVLTGGAPPPAAVLERAESLGFIVSHGYGLTETGGHVVMCAWKKEWDHLPGTERARLKARQGVGTICSAEVDVVDPYTGESVARDGKTIGEVVLRGGTLMSGYLNDEEGTSRCMKENGWFWTGDMGVMHEDGYLEIKDRSKDVIICGGENISSIEVEAALYSHPAVHEAAVVARPCKYWGETPCAFVSLKEAHEKPSEKEIREFCKKRLPLFMVPRSVVFMPELPKTSTGKIQKFLLRDMAKQI